MRLRGLFVLAALAAIVGAMLLLAGPAAAANYPCGTTFDEPGTYNIYGNQSYSGTCYTIRADGVTLNLHGGTITETGTDATLIDDNQNCGDKHDETCNAFTLMNGTLVGKSDATTDLVDIEGNSTTQSADNNVINMVLTGGYYGVYTEWATDTLIKGNTFDHGEYGVYLDYKDTTDVISGNTFTDANSDGIYLDESAGIVISGNTISGSGSYGIQANEYDAGLAINGNVLDTNDTGIYFEYDSGDQIANNYIQNSLSYGVEDYYSDLNMYTGNILQENVDTGFYIYSDGYGPVIMVNNQSNTSQDGYGWDVYEAYNDGAYGGPFSLFSGNIALGNTSGGFYDDGSGSSTNETWTNNTAWYNGDTGFYFDYPKHYTINGNSGSYNHGDGFYFADNYSNYAPVSLSNNAAYYNDDYGFEGDYPVPGSGNTGGQTNGTADCYLVAGCS